MSRFRLPVTLWLLFALAACTSHYHSLKPQRDCPDLCALTDACGCFPHHTTIVPTTGRTPNPVGVAVHEICGPCDPAGKREPSRTLILIHGLMADHEAWRFIAGDLGTDFRLLAVDLPGCGDSEAPDPDDCAPDDVYEPSAMARRVLQAVRARLSAASIAGPDQHLTIVAHSLGGMVTLRMFGEGAIRTEFGDVLDRADGVVLIAPADVAMAHADPLFARLASVNGLDIALGSAAGLVKESIARAIIESVDRRSPALREEADKRLAILTDPARRRAMQAMLRSAVPCEPAAAARGQFRPDWDRIDQITAGYPRLNLRCLILWGERDETLPVSIGYKLWAQIPTSDLRVFPACKHSPQIEYPKACAAIIRDFLRPDSTLARTRHQTPATPVSLPVASEPPAEHVGK